MEAAADPGAINAVSKEAWRKAANDLDWRTWEIFRIFALTLSDNPGTSHGNMTTRSGC